LAWPAAVVVQMMRDADATEKRKKMLPWFCEEEYTKKNVGAVSTRNKTGSRRIQRLCAVTHLLETARHSVCVVPDSRCEVDLSISQAGVRSRPVQSGMLRHFTRLHQSADWSHGRATHAIKLEAWSVPIGLLRFPALRPLARFSPLSLALPPALLRRCPLLGIMMLSLRSEVRLPRMTSLLGRAARWRCRQFILP
jgi:hypothetical protein